MLHVGINAVNKAFILVRQDMRDGEMENVIFSRVARGHLLIS